MSDAIWDDAVSWALDHPDSFETVLEARYHAWVAGEVEEVDRINTLHTRNKFAPIRRAVITSRYRLWLPIIRELVHSANEPTLILVGAAHLGGPDGLVAQLTAAGLRLTEVEFPHASLGSCHTQPRHKGPGQMSRPAAQSTANDLPHRHRASLISPSGLVDGRARRSPHEGDSPGCTGGDVRSGTPSAGALRRAGGELLRSKAGLTPRVIS